MKLSLYEPPAQGAGSEVPLPQVMADGALRLIKVADKLHLRKWGGVAPADLSGLPDPGGLLDKPLKAKVQYIQQSAKLFSEQMKPLKQQLDEVERLTGEYEASWQLYTCSVHVLQACDEYQLAAAAAHRLVLSRVLPAAVDTLRDPSLPPAERNGLVMDLMEMRGFLSQDIATLRALRAQGKDQQAMINAQLDELAAEEHLVDVMLKLGNKEDITPQDLQKAGETYQRLLAQAQEQEPTDAATAADRRGSGR